MNNGFWICQKKIQSILKADSQTASKMIKLSAFNVGDVKKQITHLVELQESICFGINDMESRRIE
jgi:hypothetical protein